jgi:N-dimethylarginine dimethylaminohydrolase
MASPNVLLCAPDYYGIEYEINPWMSRERGADPALAHTQWTALRDKLGALGCHIDLVAARPKLPDMVFTANAGLVAGKRFIRSNFRFAERRGEEAHYEEWFAGRKFEVITLPKELFFEGEGDALFCGDVLICGYRFRSDIRTHQIIGEILKTLVVSVELVEPRYYHLDTCFCPLPDGVAIWYPGAFDDYGRRAIRHRVADLIEVAPEEAAHFACNAVVVGKNIVLPKDSQKLVAALEARGFTTHSLEMTEFIKAGGACKCLVLVLDRPQFSEKGEPRVTGK